MFGSMFKKKAAAAAENLKRVEKRDLMQGAVGCALWVAFADGELEQSEQDKLEGIIRALPQLSHFGNEITTTMQRFTEQFRMGVPLGKAMVKREIAECKNDPQECEDIFVIAYTVATADGDLEEKEKAVLIEVARMLNINPRDYDLA